MREQAFMICQNESNLVLNDDWYVFYYVSSIDILTFLLDRKERVYMSIDINDSKVLRQSSILLKKRIKNKLINYGNNYYFSLNRDSCIDIAVKDIGTTLIFSENTILNSIPEKDLFERIKDENFNKTLDFEFFFSVHDFDWETVVYFKHKDLLNEFISSNY